MRDGFPFWIAISFSLFPLNLCLLAVLDFILLMGLGLWRHLLFDWLVILPWCLEILLTLKAKVYFKIFGVLLIICLQNLMNYFERYQHHYWDFQKIFCNLNNRQQIMNLIHVHFLQLLTPFPQFLPTSSHSFSLSQFLVRSTCGFYLPFWFLFELAILTWMSICSNTAYLSSQLISNFSIIFCPAHRMIMIQLFSVLIMCWSSKELKL